MVELARYYVMAFFLTGPFCAVVLPLGQLYLGWPFTRRSILLAVVVLGSIFGTIWLRDWDIGIYHDTLYKLFGCFSPLIFIALLESKPGSSAWPGEPKDPLWVERIVLILIACFGGMERGVAASRDLPPIDRGPKMFWCVLTANLAGIVIATGITLLAQRKAKAKARALASNSPAKSPVPSESEVRKTIESSPSSSQEPVD